MTTQWALNPGQSEETVFNRYAREKLGLQGADVAKFRRLPQEHPSCVTLYPEKGSPWGPKPGVDEFIRECRGKLSARQ